MTKSKQKTLTEPDGARWDVIFEMFRPDFFVTFILTFTLSFQLTNF